MNRPLLYLAAQQGTFGKRTEFNQSSITDALFVYLDGEPEDASVARVDAHFRNRPLVCLTKAWEEQIRAQYPDAAIYPRTVMKPVCRFILPENIEIPEGYRLAGMDEAAFEQHPFSHGENYPSFTAFQAEGSGAVVYDGNEIVAAASSFLSLEGEIELDVSTKEAHRGKESPKPVSPGCCGTVWTAASLSIGTRRTMSPDIWRGNSALRPKQSIRFTGCRRQKTGNNFI